VAQLRATRVIPEFDWNHDYTRILWSLGGSTTTPTYTAHFTGLTASERRLPEHTPAPLYGMPVNVGGHAGTGGGRDRVNREPLIGGEAHAAKANPQLAPIKPEHRPN
jgi:hypothetical protein